MTTLSYNYKQKIWSMILCIIFFGACAVIIGNLALTNDRGLILNRIFEFSQSGATNVYWVLCILSVGFVAIGILAVVKSLTSSKQIILGATGISAPKSAFSNKNIDIPYKEVIDISDHKVQKQIFLAIHGENSKVTIAQSALASKEQFQEMRNNLIERVKNR